MTRSALTGIGALDASVQAIVSRPMPWHGVLAIEPLEAGSTVSVRFSRLRSQGSWDGYQPGRVVHFLCRKSVHFQLSLDTVARKYGINPNQLFRWRKLMREGALSAVGADESVVPASEVKELHVRIRELERLLGRKTLENEILKDAVRITREKKLLLRMPLSRKVDMR